MGNSSSQFKIVKIKEKSEPVVLLKYTKKPEYHQSVDSNQSHSEPQHNGVKYFLKNYSNFHTIVFLRNIFATFTILQYAYFNVQIMSFRQVVK